MPRTPDDQPRRRAANAHATAVAHAQARGPVLPFYEESESSLVVPRWERELAVSHWFLAAADDGAAVRDQWTKVGAALFECGGLFSALRIPADLVEAAAGTDDLDMVGAFLRTFLTGGAVFVDLHSRNFYALVPPSTAWMRSGWRHPRVECLGRNHYLGIPEMKRTEPRGRSYWCVPMDAPGDLCYPDELEELLRLGHARIGENAG